MTVQQTSPPHRDGSDNTHADYGADTSCPAEKVGEKVGLQIFKKIYDKSRKTGARRRTKVEIKRHIRDIGVILKFAMV